MTEEISRESKISVISFVWLSALSAFFVWLGVKIATHGGYAVVFDKTEYGSIREAILSLSVKCAADIAMFLTVTLAARPVINVSVASAILALRGTALGISAAFCAENAVSSVSVAMIISCAMVSVLLLLYTVLINRIKSGAAVRVGLYLLTTGAVSMMRLLTVMLL